MTRRRSSREAHHRRDLRRHRRHLRHRLLQVLQKAADVETHLVLSCAARRTIALETDTSVEEVEATADRAHKAGDIAASTSSGSFRPAGMVVAPCSMKTASGIASCYSDNLLLRAADVTLKERRPLVLLVRETPLHIGHLRMLVQVAEMGAVVMPRAGVLIPPVLHPAHHDQTVS